MKAKKEDRRGRWPKADFLYNTYCLQHIPPIRKLFGCLQSLGLLGCCVCSGLLLCLFASFLLPTSALIEFGFGDDAHWLLPTWCS